LKEIIPSAGFYVQYADAKGRDGAHTEKNTALLGFGPLNICDRTRKNSGILRLPDEIVITSVHRQ